MLQNPDLTARQGLLSQDNAAHQANVLHHANASQESLGPQEDPQERLEGKEGLSVPKTRQIRKGAVKRRKKGAGDPVKGHFAQDFTRLWPRAYTPKEEKSRLLLGVSEETIFEWKFPHTVIEVNAFTGLSGHYAPFDHSSISGQKGNTACFCDTDSLSGRSSTSGPEGQAMPVWPDGVLDPEESLLVMARRHTHVAVQILLELGSDPSVAASVRLASALALLDRGWGKPASAFMPGSGMGPVLSAKGAFSQDGLKEEQASEREAAIPPLVITGVAPTAFSSQTPACGRDEAEGTPQPEEEEMNEKGVR
ncbi:hypothetical protein [Entomobacter blattae]|uniref:Uncharacterized protein n=1 Tax=Entomobacter blattae TaxID=2762277 RepID=A0A7H1NR55_9PROT|nr:hypothetical protein [Entomobacter blattae]QNT78265.1 hypothetical protein JGUZn3_10370 [Entomobacter blattae]